MPKPKNSFEDYLRDWGLMSLLNSASTRPESPPKFPSLVEVAELGGPPAEPKEKSRGLFDALLGNVEALYQETVEHPDKFTPEAAALARELVAGGKRLDTLTAAERQVLDLATIDFAEATPKGKKPRPQRAPTPLVEDRGPERPVGGVDVPEGAQEAYWWLK